MIGWVLFRSENMSVCFDMIRTMFSFNFNSVGLSEARIYIETYYVYFIAAFIFSTPIYYTICKKIENKKIFTVFKYVGLLILFVVSIMFLAQSNYNPFIYFRF
jgi:alginate O-acetyltransferase complex protein AlgI